MIKWLLPFILFVAACSDDESTIRPGLGLDITETEVIISASGNISANTIINSTVDWSIEGGSDWCEFSPKKGLAGEATFVTFTAKEINESYDQKTMLVTLKAGTTEQPITVIQKQKDAILFSNSKLEVSQDGGYAQLIIGANVEYSITIPDQFKSWISKSNPPAGTPSSRGLDTLKTNWFYVQPNPDFEGRDAYLVVNGPNRYVDTAWVYQYQKDRLMLNKRNVKVSYDDDTEITVELKQNVDWVAIPQDEWIEERKIPNRSDATKFFIPSNGGVARQGKVIFKSVNGRLTDTLTIDQQKLMFAYFDGDSKENSVDKAGEPLDIYLKTNTLTDFYLIIPKIEAKWISFSGVTTPEADGSYKVPANLGVDQGAGKIKFTFTVAQNPDTEIERSGKLVVRTTDSPDQDVIFDTANIYQNGRPRVSDLGVLDTIYRRWNGASGYGEWGNRPNWRPGTSLESRVGQGIEIAIKGGENRIVVLNLGFSPSTAGLTNKTLTIPSEIGDLEYLEELYIGVSTNMGALSGQPSGAVPSSLGKLKRLRKLTIAGANLTSIPDELGELPNLEELTILTLSADSDMAWIGNLTNLTKLILINRYEGALPASFGNLTQLTYLRLGGNYSSTMTKYNEIPESFGNLSKLKYLAISANAPKLPSTVGSFTELEIFESTPSSVTKDTLVTGFTSFPDEISAWEKVTSFISNNNKLTKMPSGISGMKALKTLKIKNAPDMEGSLPSMDNLKNLQRLDISRTKLTGEIPEGITNNKDMDTLDLSHNRLIGSIPEQIGNLEKLRYFTLRGNKAVLENNRYTGISGAIPESIGKLTLLTELYLDSNRLEGSIPYEIADMSGLTSIYLNDNALSGIVTGVIFGMNKVRQMYLQNNQFTSLPSEIENTSREDNISGKSIYLQNNKITNFPAEIARVSKRFARLDLSNNLITGTLPKDLTLGILPSDTGILDLRNNRFDGEVPSEITKSLGELVNGQWSNYKNVYFNPQQQGYGFTNVPNQ